jgi:protein-tyrosine-phosphatase
MAEKRRTRINVLFVCEHNMGRSQMAQAFFNRMTGTDFAVSAGTDSERHEQAGRLLRGTFIAEAMSEEFGIDVSTQQSKQLTEDMLRRADRIVWMAGKRKLPDSLKGDPRVTVWAVFDPKYSGLEGTIKVGHDIERKVSKYIGTLPGLLRK